MTTILVPNPPLIQRETAEGSPLVSQCKVPQNQSIYQALIDKAVSYPASQFYKANAYRKAADVIYNTTINIHALYQQYNDPWLLSLDLREIPNIGPKISTFICNYVIQQSYTL